jgi:hypothetical protein
VLVSSGKAHRPARVQLLRRDADLRAEPELAAVGERVLRVDHHDRRVDLGEEALGPAHVVGDDRLGVVGREAPDVVEGPSRSSTTATDRSRLMCSVAKSSSVTGTASG